MSAEFIEALRNYYSTLFPYQLIYNWLDDNNFKLREFSFTLPGDIYIRYQAFEDVLEFKRAVIHKLPIKIDAGAVYNFTPRLYRSYPDEFKPQQRELVFDIDISDYNDARTCCQESDICQKCWLLMSIGAKVLNVILTREFGFKNLLFVFSGRRGFHCWVCDREARELQPDARKAIADYLSLVKGGDNIVKRVELDPTKGLHPMIVKALEVIDEQFEDLMVHKQDFLATDHLIQNVIDLAPDDKELQDKLNGLCKMHRSSTVDCWNTMKNISSSYKGKRGKFNYFIQEVKLQHCFPRLDSNVTKGMNHLLKLPFCVHPKTGNVCVPLDIDEIDKFELANVPNVKNLSRESLDPYIRVMKKFCDSLRDASSSIKEDKLKF